jgi:hypothetical protein
VAYKNVYAGIDLVYYGNQSQLEYDFIVAPYKNPKEIELTFEGTKNIEIDKQGELVLSTGGGELKQHKPVIYQEIDGHRREIAGRFERRDSKTIGFEIAEYDQRYPLVIDPILSYSTYLGGTSGDLGADIAVDDAGNIYVTGHTASNNFLTSNSPNSTQNGMEDIFIAKLNSTGLIYSAYIGGKHSDYSNSIALDQLGNVYITGGTYSSDFPLKNPLDNIMDGTEDAFIAKLNPTGTNLIYSTYFGGNEDDNGNAIAVDTSGNAYITGGTGSNDILYSGGSFLNGLMDSFVAKLNADGKSINYFTYLGGTNDDTGNGIVVDLSGNIYVAGTTSSFDFPLINSIDSSLNGETDVFIIKIDAAENAIYSTFIGGNNSDGASNVAIDVSGNVYVTGFTNSTNFPLINPIDSVLNVQDAFVLKLNNSGEKLIYSTYLGGSGNDSGNAIAVDQLGNAYIIGETNSSNFPFLKGLKSTSNGSTDIFIAKLNTEGSAFDYSTYLGGDYTDTGRGIAVDKLGNAYITGETSSPNFPTVQNSIQTVSNESSDKETSLNAFISIISSNSVEPTPTPISTATPTPTSSTTGLQFYPLPHPVRILDTRSGQPSCVNPGSPLTTGSVYTQSIRLSCNGITIPPSAQAIVGNATVVNFTENAGYITLYPSGSTQPTTSNLNFSSGQVVPNSFTVGVSTKGEFNIYVSSTTHIIIDVSGYYAPPGPGGLYYHPLLTPIRILDTRLSEPAAYTPATPINGGSFRTQVSRLSYNGVTIPSTAKVVVGNATVVNTMGGADGYITLYPSNSSLPVVSNLNFSSGMVIPNTFTVGLGGDGAFNIYASTTTHFIVDVFGYYSEQAIDENGQGLLYQSLAKPMRILDTRVGEPACNSPKSPLMGGSIYTQPTRIPCGEQGFPATARAIVGNATVVNNTVGAGYGYATIYPSNAALPVASNLNYSPGMVVPNAFTVGLGSDGAFNLFATSNINFIVDISGYFAPQD